MRFGLLFYAALLRLTPRSFRERNRRHLLDLVATRLAEREGVWRILWLMRECADLLIVSARLRLVDDDQFGEGSSTMTFGDYFRGIRLTARTLARTPGYAGAAILTLGPGMGCALAAYIVVEGILLRPLPHREPDRLVMVWRDLQDPVMPRAPVSLPTLNDLRAATTGVFGGMEAYSGGTRGLLRNGAEPVAVLGSRVTGGLFGLLDNAPQLGRPILTSDDQPGAERVVVISHALWQRYYGSDPAVLGRTIEVRDHPHRIIGVMPRDFVFPSQTTELWVPYQLDPARQERDSNFMVAIARLRPGVSATQAQSALETAYKRLAQAYPDVYRNSSSRIESRHAFVVGESARMLWLGLAAAGLLLLIAAANLSNLFLVRALARGRELAVRSALGAGRLRIAGQLLSESALIGLAAAALAGSVAYALLQLVNALAPVSLPRRTNLVMLPTHVAACILGSVLVAVLCGLPAGLKQFKHLREALATTGGSLAARGRRLQSSLVVAQVSMSVVLLIGAGLLTSTLARLLERPVGFHGEQVLVTQVTLPPARYDSPEKIRAFYDQLTERLSGIRGITNVGGTWALPFTNSFASTTFLPVERAGARGLTVSTAPVLPNYFRSVGMQVLRGREFTPNDHAGAPPVAIINQAMARAVWPNQNPIGQYLTDPDDRSYRLQIVGVVNDTRRRDLAEEINPEIYLPYAQATWDGNLYLTTRVSGVTSDYADAVRTEVRTLDPLLPVVRQTTLNALVLESVTAQRFRAALLTAISIAAALLTLLGIYSIQSVYVSSHRRELAVRLALGARAASVAGSVLQRGLRLTALGVAWGVLAAVALSSAVRPLLFGVSALDPFTYAGAVATFFVIAAAGSYLPARRVMAIQPMTTLRHE